LVSFAGADGGATSTPAASNKLAAIVLMHAERIFKSPLSRRQSI
jgi:hypothetical protein